MDIVTLTELDEKFFEITTRDIENLTAQMHGLYNFHQVNKYDVFREGHVIQLSFLSGCHIFTQPTGVTNQNVYFLKAPIQPLNYSA